MKDRNKLPAVHRLNRTRLLGLVALVGALLIARAQGADAGDHVLLIEPKFMRPEVSFPIAGAERSVLVPARLSGSTPEYLTSEGLAKLGVEKGALARKARARGSAILGDLTPDFFRDRTGVIEYAELRSEAPLIASAVLAPDFVKRFEPVFGPELLVVIPNRFQAFIFPKLATTIRKYGPKFIEAYKESPFPVSLEVFEMTAEDMKAIGSFDRP